jgi:23S rRNA U2552 (ribose-2'-O)-methylase RlmE/FtsJ
MNLYNLPKSNININEKMLKLKFSTDPIEPTLNKSLYNYLQNVKNKINDYPSEWNYNKKYTNIYEFIHTSVNSYNDSISQLKPVSRAFYKLVEIINSMELLKHQKGPMKSFHIAEAPGGFIEALSYLRNNINDTYYGSSLINNEDKTVPTWKKSNIVNGKNIKIDNGIDGTGDLYNPDNFSYYTNHFYSQFDFVTADGGIDFSASFENQEYLASKLILCEIFYGISILKTGGNFVLKVFDIFNKTTIQFVYLLSALFKNVSIFKPKTSRTANSEKYIVCKHLMYDENKKLELTEKFHKMLIVYNQLDDKYLLESFLDFEIQHYFLNKIQEINSIIGNYQIKNILTTLKLIENNEKKNEKITSFKNENIQKCITWCVKNNIPYNKKYKPSNIFLTKKI